MERIHKRPPFVEYQECLDKFTELRKELNGYIQDSPSKFKKLFNKLKEDAGKDDVIAMDVIAYYYKTGVPNLLPENYETYLKWEIVASAKGNELAIEKLQFLLSYAYAEIMNCDDYDTIAYKNDIEDYNAMYKIGKSICKMLAKELKLYPIDICKENDVSKPYTQESFIVFRKTVDDIIPKTIDFMKS